MVVICYNYIILQIIIALDGLYTLADGLYTLADGLYTLADGLYTLIFNCKYIYLFSIYSIYELIYIDSIS